MFGIGMSELLVILIVALIIFGPTRLPELARSLGKAMAEFRRASTELRSSFEEASRETHEPSARGAPPVDPTPRRLAATGVDPAKPADPITAESAGSATAKPAESATAEPAGSIKIG